MMRTVTSPKQHQPKQKSPHPVHHCATRGIISYATNKRPNFYRAQAKKVLKKGEKKPNEYTPDPKMANPEGLTQQTLPSGAIVHIFKEKEQSEAREFGAFVHMKRPRVTLDLNKAEELIHNISTRVARVAPVVVTESSLKNAKNEFISNINNFTPQDYTAHSFSNHIVRIAPPTFMKASMFNRMKGPRSVNQRQRWSTIISQRAAEIQSQKKAFNQLVQQATNSSADIDFTTIKSSPSAPLDFTDNLTLKFRIIDAVIKATNIQVPASALATINTTADLVEFITAKKTQLDAHRNREKLKLPDNVTFIYTDAVNRKKRPAWEKYKELRDKKSIAGAAADV